MRKVAPDPNIPAVGLLQDLAAVQEGRERAWAYRRAAATILGLPEPLHAYLHEGKLAKIPNVGPSTARVLLELLETGSSETVERAIDQAGRRSAIERSRKLRECFVSHAGVRQAMRLRNGAVTRADYLGDFQMHSEWSDGTEPIAGIVEACLLLGHRCACVTDHSQGLTIAGGIGGAERLAQGKEIDRLNRQYRGRFRLFKGIEANIGPAGELDVSEDDRRQLDLVVAAPHSALRIEHDQTPRLLNVIEQRGVHVLGHPRGRKFGARAGLHADWDAVFRAAARNNVAVEIDGSPERQDLDYCLAARALDAGCALALNSDAHAHGELLFFEYALAHARLARVPAERVINCWTEDRLLGWVELAWQR